MARDSSDRGRAAGAERAVPVTFTSADHYIKAFRPLMLLEIQACIAQSAAEDHGRGTPAMAADLLDTSLVDQFTHARFRIRRGEGAMLFQVR